MKKVLLFFVFALSLMTSCKTLSSYYLKGEYSEKPYNAVYKVPLDKIWEKTISALEEKGIKEFKIFSKENGIIVSEPVEFSQNYTREDDKGKLINSEAFVVIGNFHTISGKQLPPDSVKGVVTVRFKTDNGENSIEISINSLQFLYTYQKGSEISQNITDIPVKSTGMLEKFILKSVTE